MKGVRADVRLVELGLSKSREQARSSIMAGDVYIGEVRIDKPGEFVSDDAELIVRAPALPFVSRGGLKLQKAIDAYGIDLDGCTAADIGASTGGFTDCMLQHGASRVYAIDVGYGQLDWRLRNDERVTVMERTNARNIAPEWFAAPLDFASMDVSFISVKLILPGLFNCLSDSARAVVLVKPQFEAGRGKVGKNGVVRDAAVHTEVLNGVAEFSVQTGFYIENFDYSPITGPKGNIEFLMVLSKAACAKLDIASRAASAVEAAHSAFE